MNSAWADSFDSSGSWSCVCKRQCGWGFVAIQRKEGLLVAARLDLELLEAGSITEALVLGLGVDPDDDRP